VVARQDHAARADRTRIIKGWLDERSTAILTVALSAVSVGLIAFCASQIFAAREVANAQLAHVLRVRDDIEGLEGLYTEADADFLRLIGNPSAQTLPWTVERTVRAENLLSDLGDAFAAIPQRRREVDALRQATAEWQRRLAQLALRATADGNTVLVERASLAAVNESRNRIAAGISALGSTHDLSTSVHVSLSARRLASERNAFAAAAVAAFALLVYGFLANHRLGLERARVRIAAEEGEARFREYFEEHPLPMLIYDVETLSIAAVNDAAVRQYGYARDEFTGLPIGALRPQDETAWFAATFAQFAATGGAASGAPGVRQHLRKDGSQFFVDPTYHFLKYANRQACFVVAIDVTELVQSRDLLRQQARFDALTTLPNRSLLNERLDEAIRHAAHHDTRVALIFLDVDHFKDVNDSLGHSIGDRLLREVALRVAGCIGEMGTVARYGGDEFVMVIPEEADTKRLGAILGRLSRAFADPVWIDDTEFYVETSLGIACFPADGADAETLLRRADLAMYRAKSAGRNAVYRFEPELGRRADERLALSRRLRAALANGEFRLEYQPQVDLQSNRVTGVEALLRWCDPELGPVNPGTFIPIAEENGLIVPIGEWVMREACLQAQAWQASLPGVRMSVNLSPRQFARGDIVRVIEHALTRAQLLPGLLEVEITEGALMAHRSIERLRAIRATGVGIAIDDFGTGYSSLAYIRNFHADRLKLDMSFVRGIGVYREDKVITQAILELGRELGFEVVAEGVETDEQLAYLSRHGCSAVQGYLFARPMAADNAHAFIRQFNGAPQAQV
jgi:diguanylate cyclase (GGDEF)-like protein/PAS domain S-box-containing protein